VAWQHERQRGAPGCKRRAGLAAVYMLDLGVAGFCAAVAAGFCLYAALLGVAVLAFSRPSLQVRSTSTNAASHETQPGFIAGRPILEGVRPQALLQARKGGAQMFEHSLSVSGGVHRLIGAANAARRVQAVLAVKDTRFHRCNHRRGAQMDGHRHSRCVSRCATTDRLFRVGFLREKENGIELEFREQFIWSSPFGKNRFGFWADEAADAIGSTASNVSLREIAQSQVKGLEGLRENKARTSLQARGYAGPRQTGSHVQALCNTRSFERLRMDGQQGLNFSN